MKTTSGIVPQIDQATEHPQHPLLNRETFLRNGVMVLIPDRQFVESLLSGHLNNHNNVMDLQIVQDALSWKQYNVQPKLEQGS